MRPKADIWKPSQPSLYLMLKLRPHLLIGRGLVIAVLTLGSNLLSHAGSKEEREVLAIAKAERTAFIAGFEGALKSWCMSKKQSCASEVLVRPNSMSVPPPYDQLRVDFMSNLNGKAEIGRFHQPAPASRFKPHEVKFSDRMRIALHPFVWDRVQIRANGVPKQIEPLTAWAIRWIDLGDANAVATGKEQTVIHSVVYPSVEKGRWQTEIDLGTAPSEAVVDLLKALDQMGLTHIEMGTF
ncbi:hypothetical protein PMI12_03964 [Variovorax sp. CF313]|nr:hypothetical protein PMI12_03964 [Variovorax sp. CF313]